MPSAPCVLKRAHLRIVFPTRFRASAHPVAPLLLRPPPLRHKLVPWQQVSPPAAAATASASPRSSSRTRIFTHVLHQSKALSTTALSTPIGLAQCRCQPTLQISTPVHSRTSMPTQVPVLTSFPSYHLPVAAASSRRQPSAYRAQHAAAPDRTSSLPEVFAGF